MRMLVDSTVAQPYRGTATVRTGLNCLRSQASSPTNGTFGAKKRAPSSLAAVEAREARLLAELEGKVAALSSGRIRTGRSAVRKALR